MLRVSRCDPDSGLALLVVAGGLALRLSGRGVLDEFALYVNFRFLTCALFVVTVFVFSRIVRRCREVCSAEEQGVAAFLWQGLGVRS